MIKYNKETLDQYRPRDSWPEFYRVLDELVDTLNNIDGKTHYLAASSLAGHKCIFISDFIMAPPQNIVGEYLLGIINGIKIMVTPELTANSYEIRKIEKD